MKRLALLTALLALPAYAQTYVRASQVIPRSPGHTALAVGQVAALGGSQIAGTITVQRTMLTVTATGQRIPWAVLIIWPDALCRGANCQ